MKNIVAAANAGLNTNTTDETILTEDIESSGFNPMSSEKELVGTSVIFGEEPNEIPSITNKSSIEEDLAYSSYSDVLFYSPEEAEAIKAQDDEIINDIQNMIDEIGKDEADLEKAIRETDQKKLIKYILLARILLNAKFVLGSRFYGLINMEIISPKQVFRYLRFIMTKESQEKFDVSVKAKKEDISLIVVDLRIATLTEKKIAKLKNPYMSKLINMKTLSNEDFDAVIGGDDTKYNEIMVVINDKKDEIAKNKRNKQKPDTMDQDTFDKLLKQGVYEITRKYQDAIDKEIELLKQIEQLKKSNETLKIAKLKLEASSSVTTEILGKLIPTQAPHTIAQEYA